MVDTLHFHQATSILAEPTPTDAMVAALVRVVQRADEVQGALKYGSIKWGLNTANGYQRWYADAVAALLRHFGGRLPDALGIDRIAERAILAAMAEADKAQRGEA
ncbi:MAG: hypothetical protein MI920_18845 [Kiloniellales bacterium]|nr:hypothetical protein [Kiloniellales bacterium]